MLALRVERQSALKSKNKNDRLDSLASYPLVTVNCPHFRTLGKNALNILQQVSVVQNADPWYVRRLRRQKLGYFEVVSVVFCGLSLLPSDEVGTAFANEIISG